MQSGLFGLAKNIKMNLATGLLGFMAVFGCALDSTESDESEVSSGGNVVTDWSTIAADVVIRPNEGSPALRSVGQSQALHPTIQLAIYDTVAAFAEDFEPFAIDVTAPDGANKTAAIATAAYRVLRTRVPGRAAFLDIKYAETLNSQPPGPGRDAGVAVGEEVAAGWIALRANDNLNNEYPYVQPTPGPGVFEPTAPTTPLDVKVQHVPPYSFTQEEKPNFFSQGPRALDSAEYTADWTEVRDLGRNTSTIRTTAQTDQARFWTEHTYRQWARNLIRLAVDQKLNVNKSARMLAMGFTALGDSAVTGFAAKYHFMFWRPFHSIPRADTDGNPDTTAESWSPLINVNHPEYPSGHSFMSWSIVTALQTFFKTDNIAVNFDAVGVVGFSSPAAANKVFPSLSAIGVDVTNARIYSGLHYRFSMTDGQEMGVDIANHLTANFFGQ